MKGHHRVIEDDNNGDGDGDDDKEEFIPPPPVVPQSAHRFSSGTKPIPPPPLPRQLSEASAIKSASPRSSEPSITTDSIDESKVLSASSSSTSAGVAAARSILNADVDVVPEEESVPPESRPTRPHRSEATFVFTASISPSPKNTRRNTVQVDSSRLFHGDGNSSSGASASASIDISLNSIQLANQSKNSKADDSGDSVYSCSEGASLASVSLIDETRVNTDRIETSQVLDNNYEYENNAVKRNVNEDERSALSNSLIMEPDKKSEDDIVFPEEKEIDVNSDVSLNNSVVIMDDAVVMTDSTSGGGSNIFSSVEEPTTGTQCDWEACIIFAHNSLLGPYRDWYQRCYGCDAQQPADVATASSEICIWTGLLSAATPEELTDIDGFAKTYHKLISSSSSIRSNVDYFVMSQSKALKQFIKETLCDPLNTTQTEALVWKEHVYGHVDDDDSCAPPPKNENITSCIDNTKAVPAVSVIDEVSDVNLPIPMYASPSAPESLKSQPKIHSKSVVDATTSAEALATIPNHVNEYTVANAGQNRSPPSGGYVFPLSNDSKAPVIQQTYRKPRQVTPLTSERQPIAKATPASYSTFAGKKDLLHRRRGGVVKTWQQRYVVLDEVALHLYVTKKKDHLELVREIALKDVRSVHMFDDPKENKESDCFVLNVGDKSHIFRARNRDYCEQWIGQISAGCLLQTIFDDSSKIECVEEFIEKAADTNISCCGDNTPIIAVAMMKGKLAEASILHKHGAHPSFLLNDVVINKVGFPVVLEFFIDNNADLNVTSFDQRFNTLLHYASKTNDINSIRILLLQRVEQNHKNGFGDTPLHIALREGFVEIATALLDAHTASVNTLDANGGAPLHMAIVQRNLSLVQKLEALGADINVPDQLGNSPLHIALSVDMVDIATFLVTRGADVNCTDSYGNSPLHLALLKDSTFHSLCSTLINKGSFLYTKDASGRTAFHCAMSDGDMDLNHLVRRMAELDSQQQDRGINVPNHVGDTPMHLAAAAKNDHLMIYLLNYDADPNAQNDNGETPLIVYFSNGVQPSTDDQSQATLINLLRCFQDRNADMALCTKKDGVNLFHISVKIELIHVVSYFISTCPALIRLADAEFNTALHMSAVVGSSEIVVLLLDAHVPIDALNLQENSALHLAIQHSHYSAAKKLLCAKADQHHWNKQGLCPLHMAVISNSTEAISLMLNRGADINCRAEDFRTPLHMAVSLNQPDNIRFLINSGADLTLRLPDSRRTALHLAVLKKSTQCVQAIIQGNARGSARHKVINIEELRDSEGQTAAQLCQDSVIRHLLAKAPTMQRG